MYKFLQRLRGCTSGAALPEFTLVLPIAVVLMLGTIGVGELLYGYMAVQNAVRSGTRYLARVQPGNTLGAQHAVNLAKNAIALTAASSSDVKSVCTGATRCLEAQVFYPIAALSIFGLSSPVKLTVRHDEPYIGE